MTYLLAFTFIWLAQPMDTAKVYQSPEAVSGDYLALPHAIGFHSDGRLFVADAKQSRIFVWDKAGKYLHIFSQKGEGPGELQFPTCLTVQGDRVWVTDGSQRLHIFSADGEFVKSVPINCIARVLVAVDAKTALIGARALNPRDNRNEMAFTRLDIESGGKTEIKSWPNNTVIGVEDGKFRWKAFGDDIDVQKEPGGAIYFGFSQDPVLYALGPKEQSKEAIHLNIPLQPPTSDEREFIREMTFPGNKGQRFSLGKNTNWIWDFSQPKAIYTHFLIKGEKLLLVLTPLGSIQGIGGAYSRGSYFIVDRGTGKPISRGAFEFPEDSLIFFEDQRILGFILTDDGQFSIRELRLEGF